MYIPLAVKSTYSFSLYPKLLTSSMYPDEIVKIASEQSCPAIAITDKSSLSGCVDFMLAAKSKGIKPIFAQEMYTPSGRILVYAKNLSGWKSLLKATAHSNLPENFNQLPQISLEKLGELSGGNLIIVTGISNSELSNFIYSNIVPAYLATTEDRVKSELRANIDIQRNIKTHIEKLKSLFGNENIFIGISLLDSDNTPAFKLNSVALRWLSKETNTRCVAIDDIYYHKPEDAEDQRALSCISHKLTIKNGCHQLTTRGHCFEALLFRSSKYCFPGANELKEKYTEEEIENTQILSDMCESYNILNKQQVPHFPCPDNLDPKEYLAKLCDNHLTVKPEYKTRLNKELEIINNAGLAPYFLIVHDYVKWAKSQGWIAAARGSGAGSVVTYALGISDVWADPIKYDLMFERFYNPGRASSLPDLDVDFPRSKRDEIIKYITDKYGHNRVTHISTFSRLQGRQCLTDILRVQDRGKFNEWKQITSFVPDEAKIADDLEDMKKEMEKDIDSEADKEMKKPSIILWAIQNNAKKLSEWVTLKDGKLDGPYWREFAQAMRLEGTLRGMSKHASGIIIGHDDLDITLPLMLDKNTDELICAMSMDDADALGTVKFDCLGVNTFDRIMYATEIIRRIG